MLLWLLGCPGDCGKELVSSRTFGGGTLGVTLGPVDADSATVTGSGAAAGWDLAPFDPFRDDDGGALVADRNDLATGRGCFSLERTDEAPCPGERVCVDWDVGGTFTPITVVLFGGSPAMAGDRYLGSIDVDRPSVASGSLTVERITWPEGVCGDATMTLQWAFDETDAIVQVGTDMCR